jgi:hypothetical protein
VFEQARAIYASEGNVAGETQMLADIAQQYAEAGQWDKAAEGFRRMLPNVQKISNPVRRAKTCSAPGTPSVAPAIRTRAWNC